MAELDRLLHDYLVRGRRFESFDVATLEERWFAAVERVNRTEGLPKAEAFREMDHIEAELELRGLKPPPPRPALRAKVTTRAGSTDASFLPTRLNSQSCVTGTTS
jgi:hypothetical protein